MMWDFPLGWGMGLGIFFMILFWVIVIALIIWLITKFSRPAIMNGLKNTGLLICN
jgi:hypothetical protein